jgi:hypothetical protein
MLAAADLWTLRSTRCLGLLGPARDAVRLARANGSTHALGRRRNAYLELLSAYRSSAEAHIRKMNLPIP